MYPLFDEIQVDDQRLIINIVYPVEGQRDFILMAPSKATFDAVIQGLEEYMNKTQQLRFQGMTELDDGSKQTNRAAMTTKNKRDVDADPHVELIELPRNASISSRRYRTRHKETIHTIHHSHLAYKIPYEPKTTANTSF